jgi:hypothetical protein
MLAGLLARLPYRFFFPDQLAAYAAHPAQNRIAYSLFLAGNVLLWPAVTGRPGLTCPRPLPDLGGLLPWCRKKVPIMGSAGRWCRNYVPIIPVDRQLSIDN